MEMIFSEKTYKQFFPNSGGTTDFKMKKPMWCPYCQVFEDGIQVNQVMYSRGSSQFLGIIVLRCAHCGKLYALHYELDLQAKNGEFCGMYPEQQVTFHNPVIEKCSPRFAELYSQALRCQVHGDLDLAAVGMRSALEILVKDYAQQELGKSFDEVKNKKLISAISEYLGEQELVSSADVIRIIGNDYTHYERKYPECDFDVLKKYMEIFISLIEVKLMIAHPPVSRNSTGSV